MSQNAENNDVAHKDAQSSGWKKYVPQRVNSLSKRSLLLTAGCIVAADVVAMMPQFARAGILGDEAAATVSRRKQLDDHGGMTPFEGGFVGDIGLNQQLLSKRQLLLDLL